jgi:hypothetical protein
LYHSTYFANAGAAWYCCSGANLVLLSVMELAIVLVVAIGCLLIPLQSLRKVSTALCFPLISTNPFLLLYPVAFGAAARHCDNDAATLFKDWRVLYCYCQPSHIAGW